MKKFVAVILTVLAVAALATPASAGKKPKPYKSEDGIILVGHTLLYASTGDTNSVTAKEFENTCAIPASNGFDAYVYEVPKEYQTIQANITAHSQAQVAWDLYIFFYDKDCTRNPITIQAQGSVTKSDASGVMPAGTAYVLIANFAGDPAPINYELKP